jgi:hypothetical protein
MAARYQHVTDTIREGVARQVDSLIWQAADTETGESTVPVSPRLAHRDLAAG